MDPLHEALRLIKRQAELEAAMRRPGGIRILEERELIQLRSALTEFPEAVRMLMEEASRTQQPADPSKAGVQPPQSL